MTETDLVKQILGYLKSQGVLCWRQNTGAMTSPAAGGRAARFTRFGKPGTSDILGCLPDGRFLAVEVKLPGNRPTEAQWEFLLDVQRAGGVAFWTDSLDQVMGPFRFVLKGQWFATDSFHELHLTEAWRTSPNLLPPRPKPKRVRAAKAKGAVNP